MRTSFDPHLNFSYRDPKSPGYYLEAILCSSSVSRASRSSS